MVVCTLVFTQRHDQSPKAKVELTELAAHKPQAKVVRAACASCTYSG